MIDVIVCNRFPSFTFMIITANKLFVKEDKMCTKTSYETGFGEVTNI